MKKIMVVLGTRPEAIKLYPVVQELMRRQVNVVVVSTGQHIGLAEQIFKLLSFNVNHRLGVMAHQQTLGKLTEKLVGKLDETMDKENPDLVIVQGDTASATTAAICAYYRKIPVAHVEAGLRTNDLYQPFPEEGNRRMISQIATYNFAPTQLAADNLSKNNVPGDVVVTGNTGIDTLLRIAEVIQIEQKKQVLITLHRRENLGKPIEDVMSGVERFLKKCPEWSILFPVHPNPSVGDAVRARWENHPRINLVRPLDYEEMIMAMKESSLILTDSGGIQEEAPSLNIPVLVAREVTERPEGIRDGVAILVGTDRLKVSDYMIELAKMGKTYKSMIGKKNPYGDGHASERIVDYLLKI